jgi:hypothetical protein
LKNFLINALILLTALAIVGIQVAAISRGLFRLAIDSRLVYMRSSVLMRRAH